MPDVVCRCGTYVRAYVESGTKINCPECGVVLTMGGPPPDIGDALGDRQGAKTVKRVAGKRILVWLISLAAVSAILNFALVRNDLRDWFQRQEALQNPIDPLPSTQKVQEPPPPVPQIAQTSSLWSANGNWQTPFSKIPQGVDIQALAEDISGLGASMNPSAFWQRVDLSSKTAPSANGNILVEYLKTLPVDSLSSQGNTASSHWRVLGFHQTDRQLGVLVRYFYEPLSMTVNSGDWILACRQILSQEEISKATKDVFRTNSEPSTTNFSDILSINDQSTPKQLLLTPRFGYLVLVFQGDTEQVVCNDLIGIPADVPLSRVTQDNSRGDPQAMPDEEKTRFTDFFGEYQTLADRSLAGSVFFRNREDQIYTIAEIRRFIQSISEPRAKRLAEIAEAATLDPGQLNARMMRFRKEFPNDIGADSLLISIWFSVDKGKRSTISYEDVGRVYVESAHRLYMKTSDPLLLEIKSRMYRFHGRIQDADKSLLAAEEKNHQSIYLYQLRFQESIDAGNKQDLIKYLTKLNDLALTQNANVVNPALQAKWKQLLGI
ncbi:MAG: hypothetical protein NTV29_16115 [Planctomycetota bacterium]|nr:hypothetical protein [Planctomycetota bacterium]